MTIRSLSAITLAVSDMARSVTFYRTLGFELFAGDERSSFVTFRAGPKSFLNLQLDPAHAPVQKIWGRVIFWVDDVDATHRRAVTAGYTPDMAPSDAPWGERYFHLHDPDGHELSIAKPLAE
ncbi:MAG: VOC family protein [Actinobacteria bacterium]|nr:VOC family protein [Actinomycetota bacterium]